MNKYKKNGIIFAIITAAYILICSAIYMITDISNIDAFVKPMPLPEKLNEDELPESERININTATLEELVTINGIGEAIAKNIIDYRENNNGFIDVDELINVNGIGKAKLKLIRGYITA